MRNTLLFSCLCFLLLSACKQDAIDTRAALQYIPADAASVTEIRVPQILAKADFENFKKKEVFQKMLKEAGDESELFARILQDPASSGVDLTQSLYFYSNVPDGKIFNTTTGAIIPLADSKAFSEILSKGFEGETAEQNGSVNFFSKRKLTAAWTEDFAFIGGGTGNSKAEELAISSLNGTMEQNISSNSNLLKQLKENHDIISWTCSTPYAKSQDAKLGFSMMGFDPDALEDNFIYSYVDFENGKISGTSEFDFQKEITKDFDLFFKDEVKTNFSKYLPNDDISFAFTAALDVKGINQVLSERPGTKQMVDYAMKSYDMNMSDLSKIFPGDLCLAFYNVGDGDKDAYGIFMMEIGDREGLDKLLKAGEEWEVFQKKSEDTYTLDKGLSDSFTKEFKRNTKHINPELKIGKDMLIVTANVDVLEDFGRWKLGGGLAGEIGKTLSDHIFGLFINVNELKIKDVDFDVPFKDVKITADRKSSEFNLDFKDGSENSLKQILNFANEVYLKDQAEDDANS